MKRIMSGRKFCRLLRYLHVCPLEQPTDVPYDPIFKVKEFMDYLQIRFAKLFEPGLQLSLDETLIQTFGRIKFRARIISKAARYGIKIYVLTDASTAYVLQVIIYTGKHTYTETANQTEKKTVQVVKQLCRRFKGSHRTVYVDRFYTSIDLIKELHLMELYVTGTMMRNRLPSELTIARSTKLFKEMNRGDFVSHRYSYAVEGERQMAGLVCWKDRDIVYCISNESNTKEKDSCKRRSKDGLLTIERPKMITEYNRYMGGVDLADMRRLHCNSTIMGQNRWWLKLFFYLLDVGTSNALVLYNLTRKEGQQPLTIVNYKTELIRAFVGTRLQGIPETVVEHVPQNKDGRFRCAHCALFSRVRRTKIRCSAPGCDLPLCSIGSGMAGQDCFTICHGNNNLHKAVLMKYISMKKKVNIRIKSA